MPLFSRTSDKSSNTATQPVADVPTPAQDAEHTTEVPTIVEPKPVQTAASRRSSVSIYSGIANSATQEAPTASSAMVVSNSEAPHPPQHSSDPHVDQLKPTAKGHFGWRSLPFLGSRKTEAKKPALSSLMEQEKKRQVSDDRTKRLFKNAKAEKRAKESALVVRSLIVGPTGTTVEGTKSKAVSKAKMDKVKSQLMQPKSANQVIAQLRSLPASDQLVVGNADFGIQRLAAAPPSPIHAVCLPYTDAEAFVRHFSKLKDDSEKPQVAGVTERAVTVSSAVDAVSGVANASIAQLTTLLENLRVVALTADFDLGLGQPGDGPGILSGALPTAGTVLKGIQDITPLLMAFGYATGKAMVTDHSQLYPPTDRISAITYWWGFEVVLPPPTLKYLSSVPSISHATINFLTGLSLVHGGLREILPFVRYIGTYIDTEFDMIKKEDKGKGVVCAATWIMPAALVARSWDFPIKEGEPRLSPVPPSPVESERQEEADEEVEEDEEEDVPDMFPFGEPAPERLAPPASPPVLLPPLPQHEPFLAPNAAPPIDDTPVEVVAQVTEEVPGYNVIPPTPPAPETLRGMPKEVEAIAA